MSHVLDFDLKGHFWVFLFYLFDLLLFLFSDCRSYAVCGNWFRLRMAHFSVSCDSIASLFIFVAFVLPGPAICYCDVVLLITVICLLILSLAL